MTNSITLSDLLTDEQFLSTHRSAPTSRRLNVAVSIREVDRNGETITPRGPTIRSPPILWNTHRHLLRHTRWVATLF